MAGVGALASLLSLVGTEQSNPIGFRSGFLISAVPEGSHPPGDLRAAAETINSPIATAVYSSQGWLVSVDLYVTGTVRDGLVSYDEHGGYPGIVPWISTSVHSIDRLPVDRHTGYFYLTVSSAEGEPVRQHLEAAGYKLEWVADAPPLPVQILTGEVLIAPVLLASGMLVLVLSLHELRVRRRAVAVRQLQGHDPARLRLQEAARLMLAWALPSAGMSIALLVVHHLVTGSTLPTDQMIFWLVTPMALVAWALVGALVHWVTMRSSTLNSVLSKRFTVKHEMGPVVVLSMVAALSVGTLLPQLLTARSQAEVALQLGELSRRVVDVSTISLRAASGAQGSENTAREGLVPLVAGERAHGRVLVRSVQSGQPSDDPDILPAESGVVLVSQAYLEYFADYEVGMQGLPAMTRDRVEPTLLVHAGAQVDVEALRQYWAEELSVVLSHYGQAHEAPDVAVARFNDLVRLPSFKSADSLSDLYRLTEAILVIPDDLAGGFDRWFAQLALAGEVSFVGNNVSELVSTSEISRLLNAPEALGATWNENVAQYLKQYLSGWFGCVLALGNLALVSWSAGISWTRVRGRRAVLLITRGRPLWATGAGALAGMGLISATGLVMGAWLVGFSTTLFDLLVACLFVGVLTMAVSALAASQELRRQRVHIMRTL